MKTLLHVGIVGLGRVAVHEHLPAIRRAGGEVTAVADLVPEVSARVAKEHRVARAYESHEALVADPEVDVVAIRTQAEAHKTIALDALRAQRSPSAPFPTPTWRSLISCSAGLASCPSMALSEVRNCIP
ncbi:MAG: Gfo/Idh/MocA family protein [Opitutales bacterium]